MSQIRTKPRAVHTLPCDRCGNTFRAHTIETLCLPRAVAWRSAETRDVWERPVTTAELVAAAKSARNHPHLRLVSA